MVSTAPEELRAELLAKRLSTPGAIPTNLLASAGLNLPNRAIVSNTCWGLGGFVGLPDTGIVLQQGLGFEGGQEDCTVLSWGRCMLCEQAIMIV